MEESAEVFLTVHDVAGRKIRSLVGRRLAAGAHEAQWDGRDDMGKTVAGGVYFYRLQADGNTLTRKMILLR